MKGLNLWKIFFRLSGWKSEINVPWEKKCVICVAPHTSNWDFILGLFAYRAIGRKANFLMKEFWFFFPLKYILKYLGGIPVSRSSKTGASLTEVLVKDFKESPYLNLAVTPEGSRKPVAQWHKGFLVIAYNACVPVQLGVIDYKSKKVIIRDQFIPTGNMDKDLAEIKAYFSDFKEAARYPEKFIV